MRYGDVVRNMKEQAGVPSMKMSFPLSGGGEVWVEDLEHTRNLHLIVGRPSGEIVLEREPIRKLTPRADFMATLWNPDKKRLENYRVLVSQDGEIKFRPSELLFGTSGHWRHPKKKSLAFSWDDTAVYSRGKKVELPFTLHMTTGRRIVGVYAPKKTEIYVVFSRNFNAVGTLQDNLIAKFTSNDSGGYDTEIVLQHTPTGRNLNFYHWIAPNLGADEDGNTGEHTFLIHTRPGGLRMISQQVDIPAGQFIRLEKPLPPGATWQRTMRYAFSDTPEWETFYDDGGGWVHQYVIWTGNSVRHDFSAEVSTPHYSGPNGTILVNRRYSSVIELSWVTQKVEATEPYYGQPWTVAHDTEGKSVFTTSHTLEIGPLILETQTTRTIRQTYGYKPSQYSRLGIERYVESTVSTLTHDEWLLSDGSNIIYFFPDSSPFYYVVCLRRQFILPVGHPGYDIDDPPDPWTYASTEQTTSSSSTDPSYMTQKMVYAFHVLGEELVKWEVIEASSVQPISGRTMPFGGTTNTNNFSGEDDPETGLAYETGFAFFTRTLLYGVPWTISRLPPSSDTTIVSGSGGVTQIDIAGGYPCFQKAEGETFSVQLIPSPISAFDPAPIYRPPTFLSDSTPEEMRDVLVPAVTAAVDPRGLARIGLIERPPIDWEVDSDEPPTEREVA